VEIENRFWSKVERDDENPDKCWECVAMYLNKLGYGVFSVKDKLILAHRFAFQNHHNRLITDGMLIMHSCDNPSCVNPNHLSEGTNQDNVTDMVNKCRHVCIPCKGEKHSSSKLTDQQVLEIREKYDKKNGIFYKVLAIEYGVCKGHICDIIKRKRWSHI
jgi:hypothetical protein